MIPRISRGRDREVKGAVTFEVVNGSRGMIGGMTVGPMGMRWT
jgi:hypothetical protein